MKTLTLEAEQAVTYTYDVLGRLKDIVRGPSAFTYAYQGNSGIIEKLTRPNGSYTDYQYNDPLKRLTTITNKTSSAGIISSYQYEYNHLDLKSREIITNGEPIDNFVAGTTTYTPNNLNQTTSATTPNRTFVYDNDGNMTSGYTPEGYALTMTYDAENRMKSAEYTDSSSVIHKTDYTYTGDSLIAEVKKYDGGVLTSTTRYVRAGFLPIQERDGNNLVTREYVWGQNMGGGIGGLLNLRQGGLDYAYLYDGKENVSSLLDAGQSVVAAYAYDPFGVLMKKTALIDQPYMFSTKPYDEELGHSKYEFRTYVPRLGKWATRDPLGETSDMNLYRLVGNSPMNWVDPLGLFHCVGGANCDFTPAMDSALECFDTCTGRDTAITGGRGNRSKPNSSHARGEACDIGRNSNPDLSRNDVEQCTLKCFSNGYGQEEKNGPKIPGTHFHIQLNTVRGAQPGFAPGIQPHAP